jgi:hypothetical protein
MRAHLLVESEVEIFNGGKGFCSALPLHYFIIMIYIFHFTLTFVLTFIICGLRNLS